MSDYLNDIAIIGMSGRFPDAANVEEFWRNIREGRDSISHFTDQEMLDDGMDRARLQNPNLVKKRGILDNIDQFDAPYFGYSPREAELLDPQQRLFLQTAVECLEDAGYDSQRFQGLIGVYAGASINTYMISKIVENPAVLELMGGFQAGLSNLATRVSYKLNLRGPSVDVNTACSTSLVAIHMAVQSLLNGECDLALAGGVSVIVPQKHGYLYQEEGLNSPDGVCRAFDAKAAGAVGGNGVGIVLLKRVEDALADGDNIYAVIKSTAINNDGAQKVGFTAPSVQGQADVLAEALALANVEPESISYLEAHGTGTRLGDPIEMEALSEAYRTESGRTQYCAIGSVKTNIGHLDVAAGVAGLIKTVQALRHRQIPPSLHYREANPNIDFASSPFYVAQTLQEWPQAQGPRRAAVSSFGVGGTNAHVILEEAPITSSTEKSNDWHLLVLSAKTETALERATERLVDHLTSHPEQHLADIAYTLMLGRTEHKHRRIAMVNSHEQAVAVLRNKDRKQVINGQASEQERPVVFLFPGLGDHYVNMALDLYQMEPVFRNEVDACVEYLKPFLGIDLLEILYPQGTKERIESNADAKLDLLKMLGRGSETKSASELRFQETQYAQPAMFVIEYALARLLQHLGMKPSALMGYSIGEYVAACLAGVLTREEALQLVTKRAQLIQKLPAGSMLAVNLEEASVRLYLNDRLSMAAINSPNLCVVSGDPQEVLHLKQRLDAESIVCRLIPTTHAFHSYMMEPIAEEMLRLIRTFDLQAPQIPYVSNVTGTWITSEQATNPHFWVRHLVEAVRFDEGIQSLFMLKQPVLIEVGPGQGLSSLAAQHLVSSDSYECLILNSLRSKYDSQPDSLYLRTMIGRFFLAGGSPEWLSLYEGEQRQRLPLPPYPFDPHRYWIDLPTQKRDVTSETATLDLSKQADLKDWLYAPVWQMTTPQTLAADSWAEKRNWLIFDDGSPLVQQAAEKLEEAGQSVWFVEPGVRFDKQDGNRYKLDVSQSSDYEKLLKDLQDRQQLPDVICHFWSGRDSQSTNEIGAFEEEQLYGFYSLIYLAQSYSNLHVEKPVRLQVVTRELHDITGQESLRAASSTVLAPLKILPYEQPNFKTQAVDVVGELTAGSGRDLVERLLACTLSPVDEVVTAFRGRHRFVQQYKSAPLANAARQDLPLRPRGTYLITGGLGGVGLILAEWLAEQVQARLVLVSRTGLPQRSEWEAYLAQCDHSDPIGQKMRQVQKVESLGGEVLLLLADVNERSDVERMVRETTERFGSLDGILHVAGVPGGGLMQVKTPEQARRVYSPKVYGLLHLDQLLPELKLDFLILFSSVSAVAGEFGQVDYVAANTFLDTYAHAKAASDTKTISINWGLWQETGMATSHSVPTEFEWERKDGILPKEGQEVFARILAAQTMPQVIVSTRNLHAAIRNIRELNQTNILQELEKIQAARSLYPRPHLPNDFVAPTNHLEETLVDIWQTLLGVDQVGVHDSFFHLGGHSLLGLQLLARVRAEFDVDIKMDMLFADPTIAHLAAAIQELKMKSSSNPALPKLTRAARDKFREHAPGKSL